MPQVSSVTKFSLVGLVSISILSPLDVAAATFSNLYVFGDSLSDAGNVFNATIAVNELPVPPGVVVPPVSPPDPPYFQGRNSNGPVWVEYLADDLNLSLTNSTELSFLFPGAPVPSPITVTADGPAVSPFFNGSLSTTGVNFAFGGAQTGFQGSTDFGELIPGVLAQVNWFQTDLALANTAADADALYVVWAGANDYWGAEPTAARDLLTTTAVSNLETAVEQLYATGARNFLLPNLPDLGQTPRGRISVSETERLTSLTLTHNTLLDATIDTLSLLPDNQIISLDAFSLFNQAIQNPAAFDYDNVTDGCLLVPTCLAADPATQNRFLFWDDRHPTTAGHQELASSVFTEPAPSPTSVPEPSTIPGGVGLLAGILLVLRQRLSPKAQSQTAKALRKVSL
ncbi:MAG: SGNH/GDSL hydrolase family protein [Cyanobacteria bacterium P01_F01_bin.13]